MFLEYPVLKFVRAAAGLLLAYTLLCLLVPFQPTMPGPSLDPSWRYAINEAVAQGMVFGKDIIFTFGPYGSIYTQMYHPATDARMMAGSLYLAVCFIGLFLWLSRRLNPLWRVALALTLGSVMYLSDALFFAYPLGVAMMVYDLMQRDQRGFAPQTPQQSVLLLFAAFSPLGFIPLIKGSMLPLCIVVAWLAAAYALFHRNRKVALLAVVAPPLTMMAAWLAAAQPLTALPTFFLSMLPIISGYTEAMQFQGPAIEKYLFVAAAGTVLASLLFGRARGWTGRLYLLAGFGLFLFLSFKAGFVRHDGHALIATSAALIAAILSWPYANRILTLVAAGLSVWGLTVTIQAYVGPLELHTKARMREVYGSAVKGLRHRVKDDTRLDRHFENARAKLRAEGRIPSMPGTTDIYPFDQAYLLATDNHWNPRPVLQSYSAYTPELEALDAAHIAGDKAPDNIVFRVFGLDSRLPTLEDGPSWPLLFARYEYVGGAEPFGYLKKKSSWQPPTLHHLSTHRAAQGQWIEVPRAGDAKIYAKVHIGNTLQGKVMSQLYRPSPLRIQLWLAEGELRDYRLVSKMGAAGFVLSPLIDSHEDFRKAFGDPRELEHKTVAAVRVLPEYGSMQWDPEYTVEFHAIDSE